MIRGSTDHAPMAKGPTLQERMDEAEFIQRIREKRNKLEYSLRRCEILSTRDRLKARVEEYNIMIQGFGHPAYGKQGKKHKARF